jgi:hypothetical protein
MAKYLPHGTTFTFGGVAVGGLVSIGVPDRTRGAAETTDSSSGFNRDYIPGLRDTGNVELSFRHDPADTGQIALVANYNNDTSGNVVTCVLTLPAIAGGSNRTYTFDAFVIKAPSGALALTDDTTAELTCSLQVASPVVIT